MNVTIQLTGHSQKDRYETFKIRYPHQRRARRMDLKVDQATIDARRAALETSEHGYRPPAPRRRRVSPALRAYAVFASSADTGGVRDLSKVEGA